MTRSSEPLGADFAEATEHFAHWRLTRSKRSEPTPAALRERAVALLAEHPPSTVARVLGINTVMLERWSSDSSESEPGSTPSRFVALPDAAPEPFAPGHHSPELVLRWPGGAELVARGAIPHATLRAILEAFAAPGTDPATRAPAR